MGVIDRKKEGSLGINVKKGYIYVKCILMPVTVNLEEITIYLYNIEET